MNGFNNQKKGFKTLRGSVENRLGIFTIIKLSEPICSFIMYLIHIERNPYQTRNNFPMQCLISGVKQNTNRAPAPTTIRRLVPTYFPAVAKNATHVFLRRGKHTPLSPLSDGPLPIIRRVSKSTIEIQVGHYRNGSPRLELHHWNNCDPIVLSKDTQPAEKPQLGRKPTKTDT